MISVSHFTARGFVRGGGFAAAAFMAVISAQLLNNASPACAEPSLHEGPPFRPGERLVYDITWMGILGGEGTLSVLEETSLRGRRVFALEIVARSAGWVKSLYPVEDRTLSFFDIEGNYSRKVEISISENRYRKRKVIEFYQEQGKAYYSVNREPAQEFTIDPKSQDSFSALYALRTMRDSVRVGEVLMIPIFEDKTRYMLEVRVLRRERIELERGLVDTVVIEPKLLTEGIFSRKGSLVVWLTDDRYLTPVKMQSKVLIGHFDAALKSYNGANINFIPK